MNATLGWDLSCRHASSHGIVSEEGGLMSIDNGIEAATAAAAATDAAFEVPEAEVELPQTDCPQSAGFPQHPPPVVTPRGTDTLPVPATCASPAAPAAWPGQFSHCDVHATELLIAAQKALPNASSAHARQLDGSPEQVAVRGGVVETWGWEGGACEIGKMLCWCDALGLGLRRRRGTAGWKAGRLSRMDCCEGTVGVN